MLESMIAEIGRVPTFQLAGKVASVKGLLLECVGIEKGLSVGARCRVDGFLPQNGTVPKVICEVVGFREDRALLMPFGSLEGIGLGSKVTVLSGEAVIYPSDAWLGRVLNAFGESADASIPLPLGEIAYPIRRQPPEAHSRQRVRGKVDMGVRALNTFLTCCKGQRLGIFAGSGVGKSILMSMLAKYSQADVNVIGLIGERGREVQEFIEDNLGEEGLKRSVVVVATSSDPALTRRQAAHVTLSVAEYFRDQGKNVLLMMDSVTRFAMAQREIGPFRRRTAHHQRLYPDRICGTAGPAGTRGSGRSGAGLHYGAVQRAGGRRRHERTHRRRGARYLGRAYRAGPRHCRTRPLPRHQRAAQRVAYHARLQYRP